MKRSRGCLLAVLALLQGCQPPSDANPEQSGEPVVVGSKFEIHSEILNETRPLLIATPQPLAPGGGPYPVLYVLDGGQHFQHTSGLVRFLYERHRIPRMLVVAVPNTHRTRDLSPPTEAELDIRFAPEHGGADAFLRFFTDELIPYVEKNYPTHPYRILAGHSLGGTFAIHALLTRPDVFNAYIVIDPNLQWNNQALISQAAAFAAKTEELQADLHLTATRARIAADASNLAEVLQEKVPRGFRWTFRLMPEETHNSIPHRSIYLGLDAIFDGWHLANPPQLYDEGGIEAIHRHFEEGAKRAGIEHEPPTVVMAEVVWGLVEQGRLEEAAAVLLHDADRYPPTWNQLDAIAREYDKRGDIKQQIHYYTLSLREYPGNDWARKRLTELGVEVNDALIYGEAAR